MDGYPLGVSRHLDQSRNHPGCVTRTRSLTRQRAPGPGVRRTTPCRWTALSGRWAQHAGPAAMSESMLTESNLTKVRGLNEIAGRRDLSLA